MLQNASAKLRRSNGDPRQEEVPPSQLSRHMLRAQEAERKRISRELHDGAGQGLMILRLYLAMLANDGQTPESEAKIREALSLLDHTVEDLRRIINRLSPRTLEELGLLAAIRKEARDVSKATAMKAHVDLPESLAPLDHELEVAIYRCLQEALHNVARHSQARNFSVRLKYSGTSLCLLVEDDGAGISSSPANGRVGLPGMKERIAALEGKVLVRSRRDKGTRLKIVLPVSVRRPAVGERGSKSANHYVSHPEQQSGTDRHPLAITVKSS